MLYLIKVGRVSDQLELLKIGFTNNLDQRLNQYKSHNPLCEVIATREGDENLEGLFHARFRNYLYSDYGKEWFVNNSDIIEGFDTLEETDLIEYIWCNRNDFKIGDLIFKNPVYSKYSKDRSSVELERFREFTVYEDRMKYCCDLLKKVDLPEEQRNNFLSKIPLEYSEPILKIGIKFIESVYYKKTEISEKLYFYDTKDERDKLISASFILEKWYSVTEIKNILQQIYNKLGYKKKKPVASLDLNDVFNLVPSRIQDYNINKRVTGYIIKPLK